MICDCVTVTCDIILAPNSKSEIKKMKISIEKEIV